MLTQPNSKAIILAPTRELAEQIEQQFVDELINSGDFRPEFLNRFDEIILFRPLTKEELMQVVDLALHIPDLVSIAFAEGLILQHFQRHSIWTRDPDYMALVLSHPPAPGRYDPLPTAAGSRTKRILERLSRWLRR